MTTGDKVTVTIRNPDSYAMGASKCLDGKTGTVERLHPDGRALVAFDTPASTWWTHQTPATGFWFDADELVSS